VATLPIELELDKRSTAAIAREVEQAMSEASRNITRDFNRSMSGMGVDLRRVGRDAGNSLREGISGSVDEAVRGVTSQFGAMGQAAQSVFSAIPKGAAVAAVGVAGIGLAAVAAGRQLYDMGAQWDNVVDGITGRTGIVGAELTSLTNTVKELAATTALPIENIGDIAGAVAQSLHLTDAAAAQMIQTLSQIQQVTGQAVNVRGLGQAFRVFDIKDTQDQLQAVDDLRRMSQATGISINDLAAAMRNSGKATKEAGLDWSQTAALLGSFEEAGVDLNRVMPSISIALKNFAKDGRDPADALRETISEIERLGDSPAAARLAQETFGRGYIDFLNAIKGTDVSSVLNGTADGLENVGSTLEEQLAATEDWAEQWEKFSNRLKTDFEPTASLVFRTVGKYLEDYLLVPLKAAQEIMVALQPGTPGFGNAGINAPAPITPGSPLGTMILGQPGAAPGSSLTDGWRTGPGLPAPLGLWDTISQVDAGSGIPGPQSDLWRQPDKGKGPSGPVVPYSGDPMSLIQGFAPTSALYGAAESVLSAQHARAQAEAELNALEADNTATAEQIQEARNKLVKSDSDIYQAELRLNEAKQSATEKHLKTLEDATGKLGEIGAQLDSDFGISKGLAGIAENLTKFIANLAAAPLLGQLNAIAAANPSQGGYGLMGILGSQGAFGPNFTGIDYTKNAGYGASAIGSGSAASTAIPGIGTGEAYGLPAGTNTGGYGSSGAIFPPWVHAIEQAFGIKASTYPGHQEGNRNEPGYAPNPQGLNRGIDWSGSVENMQRFADYLTRIPGALEQVIWQNPNTGASTEIAGGRPQPGYFAGDLAGHQDHVHTRQSQALPLPGGFGNAGYTASSGPVPVNVVSAPGMQQWSADWNAIAQKESGGNWTINSGNGYSGGLQFTPSSWEAAGGTQYAPAAYQASPYQQAMTAEQLLAMQGPTAWPNTFTAGNSGPAPDLTGVPSMAGGPRGGGMPQAAPFGRGPTQIGAAVEPQAGYGKGGVGLSDGAMGMAMMAAGGLDLLAPGAGQAAQTGIKLANRAIQYGGQVAGIMTQGALETWLPTGGSELANKNWFSRLLGGIAGAAPALPNTAGKSPAGALGPDQAPQGGNAAAAVKGGDTNISVTNNRATEDGTGRDIAYHQQNMYAQPGKP
jgi:hypothetical protein